MSDPMTEAFEEWQLGQWFSRPLESDVAPTSAARAGAAIGLIALVAALALVGAAGCATDAPPDIGPAPMLQFPTTYTAPNDMLCVTRYEWDRTEDQIEALRAWSCQAAELLGVDSPVYCAYYPGPR